MFIDDLDYGDQYSSLSDSNRANTVKYLQKCNIFDPAIHNQYFQFKRFMGLISKRKKERLIQMF